MPGDLRPGGRQQGERVGPEDLDGERVIQPGLGELAQLGHRVGQRPVDVDQAADAQGFGHGALVSSVVCGGVRSTTVAEASDLRAHDVGFVGAGQLARMAAEAASALGLSVAVLAERPDDAACAVAAEVLLGSPLVEADLRALAARAEVLTFDHEQVDLSLLRALAAGRGGHPARPGDAGDGGGQGPHAGRRW